MRDVVRSVKNPNVLENVWPLRCRANVACLSFFGCVLVFLIWDCSDVRGSDDEHDFFERNVRPIFLDKCIECHGDENPESGLRLTSKSNFLRGGDSGPVAIARSPETSVLIEAVQQRGKLKMPPDGRLSPAEIDALSKWVFQHAADWQRALKYLRRIVVVVAVV